MVSGSSARSTSWTPPASTATWQVTPNGTALATVRVWAVAGSPVAGLDVYASAAPVLGHAMVTALASSVTLSLNVSVMLGLAGTPDAPCWGLVLAMLGAVSAGVAVAVAVGVRVLVAVAVAVSVAVGVSVAVSVGEGVLVGVSVAVGV